MSIYWNKFQNLTYLQRRKKLLYRLHQSFTQTSPPYNEIAQMIEAINHWESRFLTFTPSPEGIIQLHDQIRMEVEENDPYQESVPFDDPQKQRQLLPHKVGIILENIRSPFNVGAFFRMGEAFGIHEILIIGQTPSPENQKKVWKTAKGSQIPFRIFENLESFLAQEEKITLIGIEKAKGSLPLKDFSCPFTQPLYLVFGNEEFGIPPQTLEICSAFYHIPMLGAKNSLNVSVAGGIALYHLVQSTKNFINADS